MLVFSFALNQNNSKGHHTAMARTRVSEIETVWNVKSMNRGHGAEPVNGMVYSLSAVDISRR